MAIFDPFPPALLLAHLDGLCVPAHVLADGLMGSEFVGSLFVDEATFGVHLHSEWNALCVRYPTPWMGSSSTWPWWPPNTFLIVFGIALKMATHYACIGVDSPFWAASLHRFTKSIFVPFFDVAYRFQLKMHFNVKLVFEPSRKVETIYLLSIPLMG